MVTIKDMDYSDELADENSLEYYDFTIQFCNEVHIFHCMYPIKLSETLFLSEYKVACHA